MKTDSNCIFCKIVAGQMPCFKLLEDDGTLAIMDIYPANEGHCLVLSKEHFPTVFDIRACPEISESTFDRVKYWFTTLNSYHMLWW
jgi:diadenosine tetraphosphate (Ap4A) HIT family hydrolase